MTGAVAVVGVFLCVLAADEAVEAATVLPERIWRFGEPPATTGAVPSVATAGPTDWERPVSVTKEGKNKVIKTMKNSNNLDAPF